MPKELDSEQTAFMFGMLEELLPKTRDPITLLENYGEISLDDLDRLKELTTQNADKLDPKTAEEIKTLLENLTNNSQNCIKQSKKISQIVDLILNQISIFKTMKEIL